MLTRKKLDTMTSWQPARTVAQCTDILTASGMPFELDRVSVEGRMLPVFKYMEPVSPDPLVHPEHEVPDRF